MCGIVGYIGSKKTIPVLINGLSHLEYRGYDSAGIAVLEKEGVFVQKTKGMLENLKSLLLNKNSDGCIGIGHTRWATHGAPSDINSHPHVNSDGTIAIVHNGIIENYIQIKEELIGKGYTFVSDTDTETIVHLIDFYHKSGCDIKESVVKAVGRLEGSYALGVISSELDDAFIATRKDSPLIIGLGEGENFISSDVPAILNYTKKVHYLNDRDFALIKKDSVTIFDADMNELPLKPVDIMWDIDAAEKGGYEHFMLKEMFEQPDVIRKTIFPRINSKSKNLLPSGVKLGAEELKKYNKIYLVGCGSAYHAGLVGKYLIERVCRMPVSVDIASEFRYSDPLIDEKTLVIVISQSGETADTLAALRLAKSKGCRTIAIVNVVGSSIAREADDVLLTLAGPEIAVASTKAFSSQVAYMYILTCHIGLATGKISDKEFTVLKAELEKLPELIEKILAKTDEIKKLMQKYKTAKNVFYIGRGLDYVTSMEGSLKLKEIAYVHSEPYAAGELKHGPIALIEKQSLIIGVAAQEELLGKTASNIKECKSRGARALAIAMEGNDEVCEFTDDVFYIPRTHWMFTPVLANIPQQLFAYYMSVGLGYNVDKPRNLAKSVTVE